MITERIIGIDLSLTSTGISTYEGETVIRPGDRRGMERIDYIVEKIQEITFNTHSNPVVMIEGYAMRARNTSHVYSLGEVGGVVRYWMWASWIPYIDVPPTVRAKAITGRGNASKTDVISHITKRTGKVWEGTGSDDKADAWGLREMALVYLDQSEYDWTKAQLDALKGVDWTQLDRATGANDDDQSDG